MIEQDKGKSVKTSIVREEGPKQAITCCHGLLFPNDFQPNLARSPRIKLHSSYFFISPSPASPFDTGPQRFLWLFRLERVFIVFVCFFILFYFVVFHTSEATTTTVRLHRFPANTK